MASFNIVFSVIIVNLCWMLRTSTGMRIQGNPNSETIIVIDNGEDITPNGWEVTGANFNDSKNDFPPFVPGDAGELQGSGIWYWYKDHNGGPDVHFQSKPDTYENAESITLNIRYFAFSNSAQSNGEITPVQCPESEVPPCSEPLLRYTSANIWNDLSVQIDVSQLPIVFTANINNGDWLLFEKVEIILTTVATTTTDPTTTPDPTTTQNPTTTQDPTTTPDPTTTQNPTTTADPKTTEEPTTTPDPTTPEEPTTTPDPTTTEDPNTTPDPTTTEEPTPTQDKTTTEEPTPTQDPKTTEESTTTQDPTNTEEPTTTQFPTTTEEPTTTQDRTTTQIPTTTLDPASTQDTSPATTTRYPTTTHTPTIPDVSSTTPNDFPTTAATPPFYENIWFIAFCISTSLLILVILLCSLMFYFKTNRRRRRRDHHHRNESQMQNVIPMVKQEAPVNHKKGSIQPEIVRDKDRLQVHRDSKERHSIVHNGLRNSLSSLELDANYLPRARLHRHSSNTSNLVLPA